MACNKNTVVHIRQEAQAQLCYKMQPCKVYAACGKGAPARSVGRGIRGAGAHLQPLPERAEREVIQQVPQLRYCLPQCLLTLLCLHTLSCGDLLAAAKVRNCQQLHHVTDAYPLVGRALVQFGPLEASRLRTAMHAAILHMASYTSQQHHQQEHHIRCSGHGMHHACT
jgi:hypothetical protein